MNKKYYVLCVLIGIILSLSFYSSAGSFNSFKLQVDNCRKAWKMFYPNMYEKKKDKIKQVNNIIETLELNKDDYAYNTFCYIHGRLMYINKNMQGANKYIMNSISVATLPECFSLYQEDKCSNIKTVKQCNILTENILPVSSPFPRAIIGGTLFTLPNPSRPNIPILNKRETWLTIAILSQKTGLYEFAWRCYVDVIYMYSPPYFRNRGLGESWFSEKVATYWLEAARCAFRADREKLAWSYLCKAAVFGSEKTYNEAMLVAMQWGQSKNIIKPEIPKDIQKKLLKEIVNLYCKLNAHPRALLLIEEHPELFDEPEKLRKEVETKWLEVVGRFCRFVEEVTIYGVQVYPRGNPLDVRIPWAFPEDAVKKAKQQLVEKLKNDPL